MFLVRAEKSFRSIFFYEFICSPIWRERKIVEIVTKADKDEVNAFCDTGENETKIQIDRRDVNLLDGFYVVLFPTKRHDKGKWQKNNFQLVFFSFTSSSVH